MNSFRYFGLVKMSAFFGNDFHHCRTSWEALGMPSARYKKRPAQIKFGRGEPGMGIPPVDQPMLVAKRLKIAATWARVAVLWGFREPSVMPLMRPSSMAQAMASAA